MEPSTPIAELETLRARQLLRQLSPVSSPPGVKITREDRLLWNFSSNDYLGLASHPTITQAFIEGIHTHGAGSTASRLVCGSTAPHQLLEEKIAAAKHTEAALTFTSGYTTALSAIPVIAGKGDFIILDKLAHASLIDAAKLSPATLRIFPHNNPQALAKTLTKLRSKHPTTRLLVVTESIFSMDGDLCPLLEILTACENHDALLLLDEAHATGILGPTGMGLAEQLGLQNRVHFQMGTLSKALGLSGGYLAASRPWIDLLINRARPFIYTTAPPPAIAAAAIASLELVRSSTGADLRKKLFANIHHLRPGHPSAIIPHILGDNQSALQASAHLAEHGLLIPAIRYPTVPRNTARLRITLSALHPPEAITLLLAKQPHLKSWVNGQ